MRAGTLLAHIAVVMRSFIFIPLISASLFLSGCQDIVEGGQDLSYTVRENVVGTAHDVRNVFRYQRKPDPSIAAVPYIFCYKVMQDVICYDEPQPGREAQLVGWQGRPAPEYVITDRTPVSSTPVTLSKPSTPARNSGGKLEPLTPVFVDAPTPVKEQGTTVKIKENQDAALY